ncbi:MAG: hypothetical protein A2033_14720 [Bacteroidetes bacterium GWA2_31_9]|nr:MAG: hypothetical protein A2033_14720 [Bacteroidetes bacterium GWA2_31_9]
MMHKYIKEIIEKQGRLILPDLGAFLTKNIDDKKVLFFNDVLKYNDGTLSGFLAEKEGIDKTEAQKKVTNFIDEINNSLVSDSKFEIADLGMLYKDQKGYINFRPIEYDIVEEKIDEIEIKVEPIVESTIETTSLENDDMLEIVTDSNEISNIKPNNDVITTSEIINNDEILEIESEKIESEKIIEEKPITKIEEEKIVTEKPVIEESKELIQNTGSLVEFNSVQDSNIIKNIETPEPTEKSEKVEEKKVKTPEAKKSATKDKKVIEKELHKTANQKPKKSLKPLIIAAFIIVPIIILGVVGFIFKEKVIEVVHGFMGKTEHKKEIVEVKKKVTVKDNETTTVIDSTITDSDGKTEEINTETVTKSEEVAETPVNEENKVVANKTTTTDNNSGNLKYHAIAASFTTTKDAEKYMNKLIEKGYNSQILDSGNGKVRVSYNSFATRQEAVDEISKLTSQGLQSWVLNQ